MLYTEPEQTDLRMKALSCLNGLVVAFGISGPASSARAEWRREAGTGAWEQGTNMIWQFDFSLRLTGVPFSPALVSDASASTQFRERRARPDARALAGNFQRSGTDAGAIALLSDPAKLAGNSSWYAVISEPMRFLCSAILAPRPIKLAAEENARLRYRVLVRPDAWIPEGLKTRHAEWMKTMSGRQP